VVVLLEVEFEFVGFVGLGFHGGVAMGGDTDSLGACADPFLEVYHGERVEYTNDEES
jgi:hypothetical protein